MPSAILVPVDGSDKDARALAVAADLAQLADASVLVVRVRNPQAESAPHESRSSLLKPCVPPPRPWVCVCRVG